MKIVNCRVTYDSISSQSSAKAAQSKRLMKDAKDRPKPLASGLFDNRIGEFGARKEIGDLKAAYADFWRANPVGR